MTDPAAQVRRAALRSTVSFDTLPDQALLVMSQYAEDFRFIRIRHRVPIVAVHERFEPEGGRRMIPAKRDRGRVASQDWSRVVSEKKVRVRESKQTVVGYGLFWDEKEYVVCYGLF